MTIADASGVIALSQVDLLHLLPNVFGEVTVPPAVLKEAGLVLQPRPPWLSVLACRKPIPPLLMRDSVGPGEREVIALALEHSPQAVLLDERLGRSIALSYGLPVIGSIRVLITAKRRGHIRTVRPHLDAMIRNGFRVSAHLYRAALIECGEIA